MASPYGSDELRTLIESSSAELDSWLSQQIQDELGTRAFVLRAIAWCRRGELGRAREDVEAALAKRPAHELVELTAAMISFVTRDYDRSIALLVGVARRHPYMAAQTLRLLIARATRLGWTLERREAEASLRSLGVRDLRAHLASVQARRSSDDVRPTPADDAEAMAQALARGDHQAVLDPSHAGNQSPRAWRLRAEAALALGDLEQASRALAQAKQPEHVHTLLLRALIDPEPSARVLSELLALAPGLLSDAARELGITLWLEPGRPNLDTPAQVRALCRHALGMLTPERADAAPSYRCRSELGDGRLRQLAAPTLARSTHAEDDVDLAQAAQLLLRAIEKRRGTAHRATATRSLSADQIEQFMHDGYVHLHGAFPRELADSIIESAHRRLREDPRRTLAEGRSQRWASKLADYDPGDPGTWPDGRIDIVGERTFTIAEFSPFAERAVFQLVGDAARVRTRSWTSNLIAQYPQRKPLRSWIPGPAQESWHLDSPSTSTRLDQLTTGLLVFIVFSDLESASGNTWLALDSPAKVARVLAAAPEGVDFCSDRAGCAITRECERFFELTGEAGDLLLVHPLMLHSASLNPSPRIRFLGNPMVYLQEPLDHRRADASPVERLIARALG